MTTTTGGNKALIARDQAHLVHPLHDSSTHAHGRVWVKGEGATLTDADGQQCIDGLAGLWNVTAGHGRKELADTMQIQASQLAYVSGYSGNSNTQAIELAEQLADLCYPSINHFFFTSGGGESTESSIKLARAYWKLKGQPQKTKVISRIDGYHGVTLAAMSATGIAPFWTLFEPRVPGFVHIPSPYPYRYDAPSGISQGLAAANELEEAILREGADTVAKAFPHPGDRVQPRARPTGPPLPLRARAAQYPSRGPRLRRAAAAVPCTRGRLGAVRRHPPRRPDDSLVPWWPRARCRWQLLKMSVAALRQLRQIDRPRVIEPRGPQVPSR